MARKRSLKDATADPSVEKSKAVSAEDAPVGEEVKTPVAGRDKATTARKRSLKDAAADQLVEKSRAVSAASAPVDPIKPQESGGAEIEAAPAASVQEGSSCRHFPPAEAIETAEGCKKGHPSLKWIAILLLIGFLGGFFFGVGRAIGPVNLAFILIGFAGGYFFGRFIKII